MASLLEPSTGLFYVITVPYSNLALLSTLSNKYKFKSQGNFFGNIKKDHDSLLPQIFWRPLVALRKKNKSKSQIFWSGATSPMPLALSFSSLSWLFPSSLARPMMFVLLFLFFLPRYRFPEIFAWLDPCLNLSSNVTSQQELS